MFTLGAVSGETFYVFDERGNVAARLSPDGAVKDTHSYRAYGTEATQPPTDGDPFGFGGPAETRRFARVRLLYRPRDRPRPVLAPVLRPGRGAVAEPGPDRDCGWAERLRLLRRQPRHAHRPERATSG